MDSLSLLAELVALPGPPGQEDAVRDCLKSHLGKRKSETDAKGNLIVGSPNPKIVVTAHMDEIALLVKAVEPDGRLLVTALGGLHPWKLGEGPVSVLAPGEPLNGVLSFGSVHTKVPHAITEESPIDEWEGAWVWTGLEEEDLVALGVRPGVRVVVHPDRRGVFSLNDHIASYFLDDRADLVSWLLCLDELKADLGETAFVATASEETGGEGALYCLGKTRPDVCIALELGPNVPDAFVELNDQPTVWVHDSYSTMTAADVELVAQVGNDLGFELQFQSLSSGGSDASCAASHGHCARPITLGLPMENSHGFEVMHPRAMVNLARLTVELVKRLS